jgi:hypothetical protein
MHSQEYFTIPLRKTKREGHFDGFFVKSPAKLPSLCSNENPTSWRNEDKGRYRGVF